jgi:hypothetical protein
LKKEEELTSFDGSKVTVLWETYEEGKPEGPEQWRQKLGSREEMLRYLESGERYWFGKEPFGSEKRKTPA